MNHSETFSKKVEKLLAASIVRRTLSHSRAVMVGFEDTCTDDRRELLNRLKNALEFARYALRLASLVSPVNTCCESQNSHGIGDFSAMYRKELGLLRQIESILRVFACGDGWAGRLLWNCVIYTVELVRVT